MSHVDDTLPHSPAGAAEAMHPDYLELLTVSDGHYVQGVELARGGMGRILLARDRRLGRTVALKEILNATGDDARRFEREARITARLQHPSIVNVHEAGVWPSGKPFYAMTLVRGRSFDKVIAEARTLDERLALLPNVLAVADAMAYVHGEGVIHRDLKPGNILVGRFGETVVVDWGLAKDLADGHESQQPRPERAASRGDMTTAGAVMGTPAYMPLEQAEGRSVDPRADVYAIGAILFHVLSGEPPYTGASALEVLAAVRRAPPVPLAVRQPGVPPEVLTIVERAMAREPALRYPSARELAGDLRRYQTGQLVGAHRYSLGQLLRRWLHRHRAALSVAGFATAVLLVLGVIGLQRILAAERLATRQRTLAQQSRGEAEELLGFMLGDLRDKLTPLGRLDLLDGVAKKAVGYYGTMREDLTDSELEKRALAHRNVGDVLSELSEQGHTARALKEYQAALALDLMLAAKDPGDTGRQLALSASHQRVGAMRSAQGDTQGALEEYRALMAIVEPLARAAPTNAARQRDLSTAHFWLGEVALASGDAAGALAEHRASLAIDQKLAEAEPTSADRRRAVSVSHERIGDVLVVRGDTAGALEEFRAAHAIRGALAAKDPDDAALQRDLSISYDKLGDLFLARRAPLDALREFEASRAIRELLATRDPTNADRRRDTSVSLEKIGDALLAQGDSTRALTQFRAAMAIDAALAAEDPTNADRQRDLSVSHNKLGDVLLAQGDRPGALAAYERARTIRQQLSARDPTNADRRRDLAFSHSRVGVVLSATRAWARAATEFQAALAIDEALAAGDPTDLGGQADLAEDHENVGDALMEQLDQAGALTEYRAALAVAQRLTAAAPQNPEYQKREADLAAKTRRAAQR